MENAHFNIILVLLWRTFEYLHAERFLTFILAQRFSRFSLRFLITDLAINYFLFRNY